jgi:DNA-binding transcriptional ArsR family regulator
MSSAPNSPSDRPQRVFTALADPTRRSLLHNLARSSPKTATTLATEYPISRQGILKHLALLEEAGLVAVHRRGRDKRYTLTPEPLAEIDQWLEELGALWEARLMRLKALVEGDLDAG